MLRGTYENNDTILYIRRTQTEIDNCVNPYTNPYKAINREYGYNVKLEAAGDNVIIVEEGPDGETSIKGMAAALSTFGKNRGASFEGDEFMKPVNMIIFDEFINTSGVNTIKREDFCFFNLIETVNRNRELTESGEIDNKRAIKIVLLSNANTLDNDILRALNLGDLIRKMKEDDAQTITDAERGIYISLLKNDKIKDLKSKTRLYKLTKGTAFYDMALENEFTTDYFGDVNKVDYRELQPVVSYNDIYFYKHKSKNIMFASKRRANCPSYNDKTLKAFKRDYGYMLDYFITAGLMFYYDYNIKLQVKHIF